MTRTAHRLPSFGLLVLGVVYALPSPVAAQQALGPFAQGTHLFRHILHRLHLQPLKDYRDLARQPEDSLLIVLGETDVLVRLIKPPIELKDFVHRGGAVMLATDRFSHEYVRFAFGVQVVGSPVKVGADTKFAYKETEDCIFIEPRVKDSPLFTSLSVANGLSRIATNRPGYLSRTPNRELELLAAFPASCWVSVGNHRMEVSQGLAFAVGGDLGSGRVLVLSDHSVFINAMMWQPDIDNFDFAYNCVNWLSDGGKRTRVLFLEEGKIQHTFNIPLKEPPPPALPPLKAIVETADEYIGDLEKENVFNVAIQNVVANATWPSEKWVQEVVLMLTLALAVLGLARLIQARHRYESAAPLLASSVARALPVANLFDQRHQSMLGIGNFWEAARALARRGLESALGSQLLPANQPFAGAAATPPPLRLPGGWWQRWKLRRRFNRLWRLAYGTDPVRISSRRFTRLGAEVENLKTALAQARPAPAQRRDSKKQ